MTGKERVLRAIERRPLDRVPRYDSFWDETLERWGVTSRELSERFGFDIVVHHLDNSMRFPVSRTDMGEKETVCDRCGYRAVHFKKGGPLEFLEHQNPDAEAWERNRRRFSLDRDGESRVDVRSFFLRTDPAPDWRTAVAAMNADRPELFKLISFYGPYEGTWRHHGFENSLMDLMAEPELITGMYRGITELTIETLEYALSLGLRPDGIWAVEDLGCTRSTLMSPRCYRELIFPWHKRLGDFAKTRGLKFFMHSCGDVSALIPDLLEAGVEVLQPLQANTTMYAPDLKERFGGSLTLWGNISAQAMEQGREAILREVTEKIVPCMKGGGYIYHSDHSVPADVTYENYAYLMELLDQYGTY